jgi:hypothetical protein
MHPFALGSYSQAPKSILNPILKVVTTEIRLCSRSKLAK